MVDKDYELNMNGVEELINYLILLRKQNNVSEETLAKYTGITKLCIKMIEERRVKVPRLETFLQLSSFWSLKDEQIIEIYQVLCDKNKQLTFTTNDNWTELKKVDIDKSELYSLSEKLKYAASLRVKYPTESLDFLSNISKEEEKYISKSGLKHRFDKIIQEANNI